jgi:hypothetical protein
MADANKASIIAKLRRFVLRKAPQAYASANHARAYA